MITVYQEYQRRRAVLDEARNRCIERMNLTGAWRFQVKIMELDAVMLAMDAREAGREYRPDRLYMGIMEREGVAVPAGWIV